MTVSPWIPYLLGLVIVALVLPVACFMPETLDHERSESDTGGNERSLTDRLRHQLRQFPHLTHFLWTGNILLALFMFLATILGRQSTSLLLQYSSVRYGWSIAHDSLYLSFRGAMILLTFAVLMPAVSGLLTNAFCMPSSMIKDRRMSQASGILSVLGFTLTATATVSFIYVLGLVLLSLGSAFIVTTRSLATSLVRPGQVGRLYSAAAVVQSLGALLAGPLFAQLFDIGLQIKWMGLPFLLAGCLFGLATLAASLIRALGPQSEPLLGRYTEE